MSTTKNESTEIADDVSVAELVEQQQKLADRVDELETEIEEKDKRIEELENRPTVELRTGEEKKEIGDIWIGGLPIGNATESNKDRAKSVRDDVWDLEDRVEDIERGEVDPGEVVANSSASIDPADLLPLHNMYLSAQQLEPAEHDLTPNQEIAARLFPFLGQYAFSNEGKLILPSTKIADIIEREVATPELEQRLDVESPNNNTIRRAMKFVGKFGQDVMEFDDSEKTNRIEIDRDAWVEYKEEYTNIATESDYGGVNTDEEDPATDETEEAGVDEEFDRLTEDVITVS